MKTLYFIILLLLLNTTQAAVGVRINQPNSVQQFQSRFHDDLGTVDEGLNFASDGALCLNGNCDRALPGSGAGQSLIKNPQKKAAVNSIRARMDVYSNSIQVKKLLDEARANLKTEVYTEVVSVNGKPKRVTYCYRAVKDALREAGWVQRSFQGSGVARDAVTDLKQKGFVNLLTDRYVGKLIGQDASLAPLGSIIVYDTPETAPQKVSRAGHVEIKSRHSGEEGYISISESRRPTYGYPVPQHRRIIGVMYKNLKK